MWHKSTLPFVEINELTEVRRVDRFVTKTSNLGKSYSRLVKGGTFKAYDNGVGYLQVKTTIDGVTYRKYLHVLMWETFVGEIPEGFEINHIDHNKYNCVLSNLDLVTHRENLKLMAEHYNIAKVPLKCSNCGVKISKDNRSCLCNTCKSNDIYVFDKGTALDIINRLSKQKRDVVAGDYSMSVSGFMKKLKRSRILHNIATKS